MQNTSHQKIFSNDEQQTFEKQLFEEIQQVEWKQPGLFQYK